MMALSPGLPEVGGWQRTTIAVAKRSPAATSSADFLRKSSNIGSRTRAKSRVKQSFSRPLRQPLRLAQGSGLWPQAGTRDSGQAPKGLLFHPTTLLSREDFLQRQQALQVVSGGEHVNERKRRTHALSHRLIFRQA